MPPRRAARARGAIHLFPRVGTVLDIGGQDSKVISVETEHASRKESLVRDFPMNDKCAAEIGPGRLRGQAGVHFQHVRRVRGNGNRRPARRGNPPQDVAAGVFRSIARRMCGLARRIALHDECVFGGVVPVSLCGTRNDSIPAAEEIPPRTLRPLIKSSFGFVLNDSCPYMTASDVVAADATCDGKKKMYELLSAYKPVFPLQLPQVRDEDAPAYWRRIFPWMPLWI